MCWVTLPQRGYQCAETPHRIDPGRVRFLECGRGERIRTSGPCLPKTVLYQAELLPETERRPCSGPWEGRTGVAKRGPVSGARLRLQALIRYMTEMVAQRYNGGYPLDSG